MSNVKLKIQLDTQEYQYDKFIIKVYNAFKLVIAANIPQLFEQNPELLSSSNLDFRNKFVQRILTITTTVNYHYQENLLIFFHSEQFDKTKISNKIIFKSINLTYNALDLNRLHHIVAICLKILKIIPSFLETILKQDLNFDMIRLFNMLTFEKISRLTLKTNVISTYDDLNNFDLLRIANFQLNDMNFLNIDMNRIFGNITKFFTSDHDLIFENYVSIEKITSFELYSINMIKLTNLKSLNINLEFEIILLDKSTFLINYNYMCKNKQYYDWYDGKLFCETNILSMVDRTNYLDSSKFCNNINLITKKNIIEIGDNQVNNSFFVFRSDKIIGRPTLFLIKFYDQNFNNDMEFIFSPR